MEDIREENTLNSPFIYLSNESKANSAYRGRGHTPKSHQPLNRIAFQDCTNRNLRSAGNPQIPASSSNHQDPPTPTANFKLLTSLAASLAYAGVGNEKPVNRKLYSTDDCCPAPASSPTEFVQSSMLLPSHYKPVKPNCSAEEDKAFKRRDKSLGLLCKKFLSFYPEYPDEQIIISLDATSKRLGVERRRIYDIVNILEALQMVSRVCKNQYQWYGKAALKPTLEKLKNLAAKEKVSEQLSKVRNHQFQKILVRHQQGNGAHDSENDCEPLQCLANGSQPLESRREKSLGITSQKFLMLFLSNPARTISLELAAKVMNFESLEQNDMARFKTKVRRLYDIANVFQTLDIVRKIKVTENRGCKPAFIYTGPQLGPMNELSKTFNGNENPDLVPDESNVIVADLSLQSAAAPVETSDSKTSAIRKTPTRKVKLARLKGNSLETSLSSSSSSKKKKRAAPPSNLEQKIKDRRRSLVRHSSFSEICQVAEREREKIHLPLTSESSPFNNFFNQERVEEVQEDEQIVERRSMTVNVLDGNHYLGGPLSAGALQIINLGASIPVNSSKTSETVFKVSRERYADILTSLNFPGDPRQVRAVKLIKLHPGKSQNQLFQLPFLPLKLENPFEQEMNSAINILNQEESLHDQRVVLETDLSGLGANQALYSPSNETVYHQGECSALVSGEQERSAERKLPNIVHLKASSEELLDVEYLPRTPDKKWLNSSENVASLMTVDPTFLSPLDLTPGKVEFYMPQENFYPMTMTGSQYLNLSTPENLECAFENINDKRSSSVVRKLTMSD